MMTTAPDPGLTDLIAAHTRLGAAMDNKCVCSCSWIGKYVDHPTHVALVVEQHTSGRMAEVNVRARARVKAANKRASIRITQIRKEESARFEAEAKVAKLEAERDVPSRLVIEDLRRALAVQDAALATAQATIAGVEALRGDLFLHGGFTITKWEAARLVGTALEGES